MTQKTVIITGGNATLGFEAAKAISESGRDWHIVIAARHAYKGQAAVKQLIAASGHTSIETMLLDLASLSSVRSFVDTFIHRNRPPLHAIICNAGVMTNNITQFTSDGFELTFGVNHLGHFLLVNLLLPYLTAPARIIVVSGAHGQKTLLSRLLGNPAPHYTNAHDLAFPQSEGENVPKLGRVRYATSKLANLYFAYALARRSQALGQTGVSVNAFNPGLMPGTGLSRDLSSFQQFIGKHILPVFQNRVQNINSIDRAGHALAQLVTDPALQSITGKYYVAEHERQSSDESYDSQKAAELWDSSLVLVGLEG